MPCVRTVKTSSGATAVQIVHSSHRGSRDTGHAGSAHNGAELELLKAAARQRLATGQGELDLDAGADRSSKNPHCSNLERRVCCRSRINRAPPVSHAYSARRTRQEPSSQRARCPRSGVCPGVIGLFIWARIDDQRQRSFVAGYQADVARNAAPKRVFMSSNLPRNDPGRPSMWL